ncbi:NUDIX hydrolase [Cribrihabitans sp. XS_ASV171]
MTFAGAKLALFLGADLLVIRRDDRPDIPWPDYWDLPGGGREGAESPLACALRETREEVGLTVAPGCVRHASSYRRPAGRMWFFAGHLPAETVREVRLGDEGQGWRLMTPGEYISHPRAVPHFATRLGLYLDSAGYRHRSAGQGDLSEAARESDHPRENPPRKTSGGR